MKKLLALNIAALAMSALLALLLEIGRAHV